MTFMCNEAGLERSIIRAHAGVSYLDLRPPYCGEAVSSVVLFLFPLHPTFHCFPVHNTLGSSPRAFRLCRCMGSKRLERGFTFLLLHIFCRGFGL